MKNRKALTLCRIIEKPLDYVGKIEKPLDYVEKD